MFSSKISTQWDQEDRNYAYIKVKNEPMYNNQSGTKKKNTKIKKLFNQK